MVKGFRLYVLTAALLCVTHARADVASVLPTGDLESWGALALGLNGAGSHLLGDAVVQGDVGVGGVGNIGLTDSARIEGDLYYRYNGMPHLPFGGSVTGTIYNSQKSFLDQEVDDALALGKAAASLAATRSQGVINLGGSDSLALSGAPGETVVLNLRTFAMSGNSLLTLNGAVDTNFVINVSKGFSLSGAAQIVLSGGLDWNNVLFNVCGKGPAIQITGTANLQGILLATRRTVQMRKSAFIRGEVIADALAMQGSTQIVHPAVVSP